MPGVPADNELTVYRVELGKLLFFDPNLSSDRSVSCASCHVPDLSFSDGRVKAVGVEGRTALRNTPSLTNVAYHSTFMRDGGVPILEAQVLAPLSDDHEMNIHLDSAVHRLALNPDYRRLAMLAYNREFDASVLVRAIASYERTLISSNSAYDHYTFLSTTNALTESQKRGMSLFMGDAQCAACHAGTHFTDGSFASNGLYLSYEDVGRQRITGKMADNGKFKVPSLRNVSRTAPYMHNGSLATLEEVIDHYNSGGKEHRNKSDLIRPLHLSQKDKDDIIAFLHALTDEDFVSNKQFRP